MKRLNTFCYFTILILLLSNPAFAQKLWQQTESLTDYPVYKFLSSGDDLFAAFYGAGIYKTSDEGGEWLACHEGLTNFLARDIISSQSLLYVATEGGGVFKSEDKGQSWVSANDTIINKNVWSLAQSGKTVFAGTSSGVFYTDDQGKKWKKAPLPQPKAHHQIIFSLAVKGRTVLAGSSEYVYLSEDFGETWQQIKAPTEFDIMNIYLQGSTFLLGTSGEGVLSSEDGKEWVWLDKEAGNVRSTILVGDDLIFGSAGKGVVKKNAPNSEELLTDINEGFTDVAIKSLGQHQGKMYAGTYSHGIWRYDAPKPNLIPSGTNKKVFRAINVFPNPTKEGLVTLQYQLEESAYVNIDLFDSFGKKIAQITPLSKQYKGTHSTDYNLNHLEGGTYYFHLQLGDRQITKQIIFIKN